MKHKFFLYASLIFIFALLLPLSNALINETRQIDNAYTWLENTVTNNWQNLNTLQHEAALLAIYYNEPLKNQGFNYLIQKGYPSNGPYCWGQSLLGNPVQEDQCKIKETAIASFIFSLFNKDTSTINEWLLNQSYLFNQIYWYVQVDVNRGLNATCNISYSNSNDVFEIEKDKKIKIQRTSQCFTVYNDYWLSINKNCYDENFKISCILNDSSELYKVGFLYKENPNAEWHVSDFTFSLNSGSFLDFSVADFSKCLKDPGGSCDYEANAIAAYVLKQQGNEQYLSLLPYLIINKESNVNKNSYAFLYLLTENEQYANQVMSLENVQGFWLQSNFGQYYDTAINSFALKTFFDYNKTQTKHYLLSRQNQAGYWQCNEPGCDKLRDTSMLLYVLWQKVPGGEQGTDYSANACEEAGGSCLSECNISEGYVEDITLSYECGTGSCCMPTLNLNCSDYNINGEVCNYSQTCSTGVFIVTQDSPEGLCCYNGFCQESSQTCGEQNGYICDNNAGQYCQPGETIIGASDLGNNQQCCSTPCGTCTEIGGNLCASDEQCQGQYIGECCFGDCVKSSSCENMGGEICNGAGWSCEGQIIKTLDTDYCCVNGSCIKNCEDYSGQICFENEECQGDVVDATDLSEGQVCCVGSCVEKSKRSGVSFIVILLIIIILASLAILWLYKSGKIKIKGKRKGPGDSKPPGMFKPPYIPPQTPIKRPSPPKIFMPRITQQRGIVLKKPPKIIPKPIPKTIPIQTKPIKTEKIEIKTKEQKKAKSKTEEQLEKTLKKIKELTG